MESPLAIIEILAKKGNGRMITLTGFADEISRDLEEQLDVLESESIRYLELRGVWGKRAAVDGRRVVWHKRTIIAAGVGVSSIGSPIGKIQITDDFEPHLEHAKHAVRLAKYFQAPYVRVFSFYIPDGDHEKYRPEVIRRMLRLAQLAEQEGIVLLHENESHIYGDTGERCLELLQSVSSPICGRHSIRRISCSAA